MDRLDAMRVFLAVAEAEGFAPAARRLGLTPASVTRAVAALETRLGTRLLHRTTRIVRPTEAGVRFAADCRRILGELEEAEATAAGAHSGLCGPLGVTAPVMFGRMYVAPVLFDFLGRYPEVVGRLLLFDRIVDLIEEGLDVAVRIAHLPDSSLRAIRVGEVRRVVCAAPDYLAEHGVPASPVDLPRFDAVEFSASGAPQGWSFSTPSGARTVRPRTQLVVNGNEVAIAAAVAGRGLARVLSYQVAPEVQSGRLVIVLAAFEPPPLPIHLVHAEGRQAPARVRAFVDFAAERLRSNPLLD